MAYRWFVQLLAQMKALSYLAHRVSPRYGTQVLLGIATLVFMYRFWVGILGQETCTAEGAALPGLMNSFCYPASFSVLVKVPLMILGCGFRPSNYWYGLSVPVNSCQ